MFSHNINVIIQLCTSKAALLSQHSDARIDSHFAWTFSRILIGGSVDNTSRDLLAPLALFIRTSRGLIYVNISIANRTSANKPVAPILIEQCRLRSQTDSW